MICARPQLKCLDCSLRHCNPILGRSAKFPAGWGCSSRVNERQHNLSLICSFFFFFQKSNIYISIHLIFSFPKTNNRNLLGRHGYFMENVVNMEPAPSSVACWKGFDNGKMRHYNQCRSAMCASLLISISNTKTESLHNSSPGQEAGLQYCGILASTGVTLR